jgi:hypothetical protein
MNQPALAACRASSLFADLLERTRHVAPFAGSPVRSVMYVIPLVARIAVSGQRDFRNVLCDVAGVAIETAVRPRQGIVCLCVMIKAP